ncbi:MAG: MaoC/PaaZ C-terminal domain-containing protein, partial [Dehalococcoidia bacterium]
MVKEQICWEDVEVGYELPTLEKIAHSLMLVKWAGASGDFNPHHYEETFGQSQGTDGTIVHGLLKHAWLIQLVTNWMGDEGFMKKFSCQYRGIDYPRKMKTMNEPQDGDTWQCKGKITNKYVDGDDHCVDLEISVVNGKGEV